MDAHHVVHWSHGGETGLESLMLLCTEHHRLVHEGGFRIEQDYRCRWLFKRPDGRAVPACGYRAADMSDDDVDIEATYLDSHTSAEVRPSAEGSALSRPSAQTPGVREPPPADYRANHPSVEGLAAAA